MKKTRVNYSYILRLICYSPALLVLIAVLSFVVIIGGWSLGFLIQDIVDRIGGSTKGFSFEAFILGIVLVLLLRLGIGITRDWLQIRLSHRIQMDLGDRYIQHVFLLPVLFFNNKHFTDAYARFRELTTLKNMMSTVVLVIGVDIITLIVSSAYILYSNLLLFTVLLLFQPLLFIVVLKLSNSVKHLYEEAMKHGVEVAIRFHDGLISPGTVKSLAAERRFAGRIEVAYKSELENEAKADLLNASAQQINLFISSLAQVVFLWVGYQQIENGILDLGQLVFLYFLMTMILQPVERISGLGTTLQESIVALERFEDTLSHNQENYNIEGNILAPLNGNIRLEEVSFGYTSNTVVLENISLSIAPKSITAIIGESGSGKTTLANMLAGLLTPTQGSIYVDNIDLRLCNLESFRSQIGYVPQNTILFTNTIEDNIAVYRDGISTEMVIEAAKTACADKFVAQLPDLYGTKIMNQGSSLSGGQVQRIALARALVNNPAVLILDEATSNLDVKTEEAVLNAIHLRKNRSTTIIIAHRLNTIRQADKIIVLADGKIAEEGSHDVLMSNNGLYKSMIERQAGFSSPVT